MVVCCFTEEFSKPALTEIVTEIRVRSMCRFIAIALCSFFIPLVAGHGKEPIKPNFPPAFHSTVSAPPQYCNDVARTVQTCLSGYTLTTEGNCVQDIDEPAAPSCSNDRENCTVVVPPIFQCPPGYTSVVLGQCNRTVEVPLQFYCPEEYYDNGNDCAKSDAGATVTDCDEGELVGDTCVTVQHVPADVKSECPQGTILEPDGNCWKTVDTFDCENIPKPETHIIVPPKRHVPLGKTVLVTRGKEPTLRHLKGTTVHHLPSVPLQAAQPEPCPEKMVAVTAPRPTKVDVVTRICSKKVQVPALVVTSCPPQFSQQNGLCVLRSITPPKTLCLSGTLVNGNCPAIISHAPKVPGCPKNSVMTEGRCYQIESTEGVTVCPAGFERNGSDCVGQLQDNALECPPGLTLIRDRCKGQKVRPALSLEIRSPCNSS